MDTISYLRNNSLNIADAIYFTWGDYLFINETKEESIIINKDRIKNGTSVEERLTKKDIVNRLYDLFFILLLRQAEDMEKARRVMNNMIEKLKKDGMIYE